MALQLGWWPKSVPTKKGVKPAEAGERVDFGLEITGDDPSVSDGDEGRVKILEAEGSGKDKGTSEVAEQRLICTFHGTWHRDETGKKPALVLDVFTSAKGKPRKKSEIERLGDWEVQGYDPECYPGLGVDGFALTFLSRLFPVNFPFLLDSETEGRFIEIVTVAESGPADSPTTLATSKVLNVPIRRQSKVESTTTGGDGKLMYYTDKLLGNVVLHHESFITQGIEPGAKTTSYVAIDPLSKGTFANYPGLAEDRKLRIFMRPELINDVVADGATPAQKKAMREEIIKALKALFDDAGLKGGLFVFLDEVPKELNDLAKTMKAGCSKESPLTVPFFTFLVEQNNTIKPVAHSEAHKYLAKATSIAGGSYRLSTTLPIGAGDKSLTEAVQFRSLFFKALSEKLAGGGEKVAQIIAHEVAHSLGLMHESEVTPKEMGYFVEEKVYPLRSIMNSGTDDEPYGAGVSFSNQAKIIWRDAFGVTPTLATGSLKNKTWEEDGKNEWKTKDWSARKKVILTEIQESGLTVHRPDSNQVSPYGEDVPLPQPGTYAP